MPKVVYSSRALSDLERLFGFLAKEDLPAARTAAQAIRSGVDTLAQHPLIGRPIGHGLHQLVISFGRSGYVALYRFLPVAGEVRILGIRHQRELDYPL